MTTRCKPGDLAIIINDTAPCTANIGCLVAVYGPAARNRRQQLTWLIKPLTTKPYLILERDGSISHAGPQDSNLEHPDDWMLPICLETEKECVEQSNLLEELS